MNLSQILVLAIIQGLTEFLPISSSAHLIIPALILGWDSHQIGFYLAVHAGSLVAVVSYFRESLWRLLQGSCNACVKRIYNRELDFVLKLGLASIPVLVVGFVVRNFVESWSYNLPVIAAATIGFALLLGLADFRRQKARITPSQTPFNVEKTDNLPQINWHQTIAIGLSQVLALIPGTSRSGVTITFGLFLGLSRETAARFAILLSIPVISLSFVYSTYVQIQEITNIDWFAIGIGFAVSVTSAFCCIKLFLQFVNRIGMMPFVIYRLLFGVVLLLLI